MLTTLSGDLDDENFTAAVTMKQGDTRLIAVVLGAPGRTLDEGYLRRAEDCMTLLSYGFRTFVTTTVDIPPLKAVRVWKGDRESVGVAAQEPLRVTVRRNDTGRITYSVVTPPFVVAPVRKGQDMGDVVFYSGGEEIGRSPVETAEEVEQAGFFKRAWDTVMMGVGGLWGERG